MKPREALVNIGQLAVIEWELCELNEAIRHSQSAGFRYHLNRAQTHVAVLANELSVLSQLGKGAEDATDEVDPAPSTGRGTQSGTKRQVQQ